MRFFYLFVPALMAAQCQSHFTADNRSSKASTLILLDVDNTLYHEKEAAIEAQIVTKTHLYCQEILGLTKEKADELYHKYGSTIEGLKQTLWKNQPKEKLQTHLDDFYQTVYKNIDMSKLLPRADDAISGSTGYSHTTNCDRHTLLRDLLKACPYPISIASNSPSWHIQKVFQGMGLSKVLSAALCDDHYTPDRLSLYPTKHTPTTFFSERNPSRSLRRQRKRHQLDQYQQTLVLDDSQHNLDRICGSFSNDKNVKGIRITSEYTLVTALLEYVFKLVANPSSYEFCQERYLESKNIVDRQSIHSETWNSIMERLAKKMTMLPLKEKAQPVLRIVDLGAGLLSVLDLLLHGDTENGLNALGQSAKKHEKNTTGNPTIIHYTAYESNQALYEACHKRLLSWGFCIQEKVSDKDFHYEFQKDDIHVILRFLLDDFDSNHHSNEYSMVAPPPDLIVGCCFADLIDPRKLVPAMIRSFHLMDSPGTLLYFPITFCGTTQFFPPYPFEEQDGRKTIPSDSVAFRLYSQALSETLGHNLDQGLFKEVMEEYGVLFITKGVSNWKIDPNFHPYLYDTMLYFFGTAGGPKILSEGWDASGWINRAKKNRPTIQVSNLDLLFLIGEPNHYEFNRATTPAATGTQGESSKVYNEILFTEPEKVTMVEKETPEVGPNQVLIQSSHSLISSGTELKIFKGLFDDASLDVNIKSMEDERMAYPLAYGYSLVGTIVKCGSKVSQDYIGRLAFTFSPHATQVVADIDSLQIVPEGIAPEDAIFMPSVETALSLVHDAHVRLGENVAVYGQGLIGLLVTSLLNIQSQPIAASGKFGTITVFDTLPDRLAAAAAMGASQALLPGGSKGPFDVSIEVSGNAKALQSAIDNTSNGGRIIVGSWYGNRNVQLKLGIDFHRSHKKIQTSQVSEIPAALLGLWSKERRFAMTWELVRQIRPSRMLTKTTKLEHAQMAYEALDKGAEIAVAFYY